MSLRYSGVSGLLPQDASQLDGQYNCLETYRTPELSSPESAPDSASVVSQEESFNSLGYKHKRSGYGAVGSTSSIDFLPSGAVAGYGFTTQPHLAGYLQNLKETFPITPSPNMSHSWPEQSSFQPFVPKKEFTGALSMTPSAGAHLWGHPQTHSSIALPEPTSAPARLRREVRQVRRGGITKPEKPKKGKGKKSKSTGVKRAVRSDFKPMSEWLKEKEYSDVQIKSMHDFVNRSPETRRAERTDPKKTKRPMNCFMLYRSAYNALANRLCEKLDDQKAISAYAGLSWSHETADVVQQFKDFAEREKEAHHEAFPEWRFEPTKEKAEKKSNAAEKEQMEDEGFEDGDYEDDKPWSRATDYSMAQYGHDMSSDDMSSFHQSFSGTPELSHRVPETENIWVQRSPSIQPTTSGMQASSFGYLNAGSAPPSLQSLTSFDCYAEQIAVPNSRLPGVTDVRYAVAQRPTSTMGYSGQQISAASSAMGGHRALPSELPSQQIVRQSMAPSRVTMGRYQQLVGQNRLDLQEYYQKLNSSGHSRAVSNGSSGARSGSNTPKAEESILVLPVSQSALSWAVQDNSYPPPLDFDTLIKGEE